MSVRILTGDCRSVLAALPSESVHCILTSPPYYGLRDYGTASWDGGDPTCDHGNVRRGHSDEKQATSAGTSRDSLAGAAHCRRCGARRIDRQIGLEQTPDFYLAEMVAVFRECRRVLRGDGTLWLNVGDSYAGSASGFRPGCGRADGVVDGRGQRNRNGVGFVAGAKPKDLIGIPWRLAFALQADRWYLRQDIIWAKPNAMPESVKDRCCKAHEYVFLLSKSARYYWDGEAISEAAHQRPLSSWEDRKAAGEPIRRGDPGASGHVTRTATLSSKHGRNRRSVWAIATESSGLAHFAMMPTALAGLCIKAGCPKGGTVLDPFAGAGTTGLVADRLGRNAVLIELNPANTAMAQQRLEGDAGLFADVSALQAAE
jgi:DNA modification methylase